MLDWFVMCRASSVGVAVYFSISGTEHNRKLKFSRQTYLTHINTIFEYCHASVILGNVDVLYSDLLQEKRINTLCVKSLTLTGTKV